VASFDDIYPINDAECVSNVITLSLPLTNDKTESEITVDLFPETSSQHSFSEPDDVMSEVTDEKALEVVESAIDPATLAKFSAAYLTGFEFEDKLFQTWKLYKTKVDATRSVPTTKVTALSKQNSQSRKRKTNDSQSYFVISADEVYFEKLAKEEEKKKKIEEKERKQIERERKRIMKLLHSSDTRKPPCQRKQKSKT
jgi:hypothetical protein